MALRTLLCASLLLGCGLFRFGRGSEAVLPSSFPSSDARTPYPATAAYFGHLAAGATPDTAPGTPAWSHLYVWLPNAAPEVGVRAVSPVLGWATAGEGDTVSSEYGAHAAEPVGFDVAISLERCVNAMNPEDLEVPCDHWAALGENDDSDELPPPKGSEARTNSVLRAISEPDEPLNALIRGLYRVGIWSGKGGDPQGTFWVQVGALREVGTILIARTPGELAGQIP